MKEEVCVCGGREGGMERDVTVDLTPEVAERSRTKSTTAEGRCSMLASVNFSIEFLSSSLRGSSPAFHSCIKYYTHTIKHMPYPEA